MNVTPLDVHIFGSIHDDYQHDYHISLHPRSKLDGIGENEGGSWLENSNSNYTLRCLDLGLNFMPPDDVQKKLTSFCGWIAYPRALLEPIAMFFGIPGNIVAIWTLLSMTPLRPSGLFLALVSAGDLATLIAAPIFIEGNFFNLGTKSPNESSGELTIHWSHGVYNLTLIVPHYALLVACAERCAVVWQSNLADRRCVTVRRARLIVYMILVLSLMFIPYEVYVFNVSAKGSIFRQLHVAVFSSLTPGLGILGLQIAIVIGMRRRVFEADVDVTEDVASEVSEFISVHEAALEEQDRLEKKIEAESWNEFANTTSVGTSNENTNATGNSSNKSEFKAESRDSSSEMVNDSMDITNQNTNVFNREVDNGCGGYTAIRRESSHGDTSIVCNEHGHRRCDEIHSEVPHSMDEPEYMQIQCMQKKQQGQCSRYRKIKNGNNSTHSTMIAVIGNNPIGVMYQSVVKKRGKRRQKKYIQHDANANADVESSVDSLTWIERKRGSSSTHSKASAEPTTQTNKSKDASIPTLVVSSPLPDFLSKDDIHPAIHIEPNTRPVIDAKKPKRQARIQVPHQKVQKPRERWSVEDLWLTVVPPHSSISRMCLLSSIMFAVFIWPLIIVTLGYHVARGNNHTPVENPLMMVRLIFVYEIVAWLSTLNNALKMYVYLAASPRFRSHFITMMMRRHNPSATVVRASKAAALQRQWYRDLKRQSIHSGDDGDVELGRRGTLQFRKSLTGWTIDSSTPVPSLLLGRSKIGFSSMQFSEEGSFHKRMSSAGSASSRGKYGTVLLTPEDFPVKEGSSSYV